MNKYCAHGARALCQPLTSWFTDHEVCPKTVQKTGKMVKCPCGSSEAKEPKTVSIFQGYFFMVNFCLGTGFLGVPFSFFYGGYIAAVPTLATAAFVTWLTSTWLLEVMARAQVSRLDTSMNV